CSSHVTPNRDWFSTYQSKDRKVLLDNNKALKVKGIGRIQIKMFDGIVRSSEAWYVLGLKKNLNYLGILDSHGYRCTGDNGVIKVLKGARVVIKGKKVDGFYQLLGSTV
ncbi:hypothetical protein CFOL_v3_11582, partial [Cephalotus follicularis]